MSVTAPVMPPDPSVRDDGRCVVCLGPRKAKLGNYSDPTEDPFCSTGCCRTYHGVELPATNPGTRMRWK